MRTRTAATTAALTISALLGIACAIPEPGDPPAGPGPATVTTEADPDPSGSTSSMEGTYTYETMDDFVEAVVTGLIEPWIRDTWPRMALPEVLFVPAGMRGREGCTDYDGADASYTSESYEYCPPDMTVYLGQDTVWEFYRTTGDAGPAMGIAHEYGHHIQNELGVPSPYTNAESIDYENQADCLAGAWTQYVDKVLKLLETPDDLEDVELLMPIIASAEGEDRNHGTQQEREAAFFDGYESGVTACGLRKG